MPKSALASAVLVAALLASAPAWATASNNPPPGGAILDLNGQTIPTSFTTYSVSFTAALTNTAITFAFRDDPAFINFGAASVVDTTTSSGNLLLNGDFSGGTNTQNGNTLAPVDWTYANQYGATSGGTVTSGCGLAGASCWYDGAVQAYDAISQTIATTVGNFYTISFQADATQGGTFSSLSTNGNVTGSGGNGIDILAYAQAGLPPANVPEPATLLVLAPGLLGLVALRRRAV